MRYGERERERGSRAPGRLRARRLEPRPTWLARIESDRGGIAVARGRSRTKREEKSAPLPAASLLHHQSSTIVAGRAGSRILARPRAGRPSGAAIYETEMSRCGLPTHGNQHAGQDTTIQRASSRGAVQLIQRTHSPSLHSTAAELRPILVPLVPPTLPLPSPPSPDRAEPRRRARRWCPPC